MNDDLLKIYSRVVQIRQEIIDAIDPSQMELNPKIQALYQEWDSLQDQCTHIFKDGKCTVCGKEEK